MSHYCCGRCGLRYDDCTCVSLLELIKSVKPKKERKVQNTQKYFVTYTETEREYSPPYDYHDNGKGSYESRTVYKYAFVDDLEDLFKFKYKANVKYYEVSAQLFPTFELKHIVTV